MHTDEKRSRKNWRFLFSVQWIGLFGLCCLFSGICTGLAFWQFNRHQEATIAADKVNTNYDAPVQPLTESEQIFNDFEPVFQWQPITMTGSYDITQQRVVRNRPLNGRPGYEQLVPFHTTTGQTIIIDRGWLPIGDAAAGYPDPIADPSAGEITLVARAKPSETPLNRDAPTGQLASIDLKSYGEQLPYEIAESAYGILATEEPAASTMPVALPRPHVGQGPHLSYGIQWLIFAVLGFAAFCYGAYETRRAATSTPKDRMRRKPDFNAHVHKVRRNAPRVSDEQTEDALLDAQGY